ncbi:hypothetical protein FZEAL_128 [Fusarium zealandicum]|uniref:Uncharacterized protein n=1 Tax=Fusarium zealandicum TaxID=1053134 RepID=A0A8H4UVH9_9HYPO|nr:hypothetical protein FZEAL_128 [Fusarium zealandicum]
MAHKRKRSVSELCSSPSSDSSFDSPPRGMSNLTNPFAVMTATPIHLHSRTLKRFRNSRPSEDEVHNRTLNMLYSAQNQQQQDMALPDQIHVQHHTTQPESQQQSLHRFWNISSTPSTSTNSTSSVHQPDTTPSSCDDCGTGLGGDSENEMEVDGFENGGHACGACGKHVCFSCSVSNLGEQRRCLQCAGRKGKFSGTSWNGNGVSLF